VPPSILGVIPARFASSRFPGKPLVSLAGKPMIQHVWERASRSRYLRSITIATDDRRIEAAARAFGASVTMTRPDHVSGTDRAAEAASITDASIIVNIQGDEPLIAPEAIDAAILSLLDDPGVEMATLKKRITAPEEIRSPNVVKVVTDPQGYALYFSRSPIPYDREGGAVYWKHIGLYVYRRGLLLNYSSLRRGPLEMAEHLEQLRALENGVPIRVAETDHETFGVDTPEDLEKVQALFEVVANTSNG
jgi:3-deoxy-manno-octulosonate cytidylyltransferase (CMP-KDO synthetase)